MKQKQLPRWMIVSVFFVSILLVPCTGLTSDKEKEKQKQLQIGKEMYGHLCYKCHDYGQRGAPRLGYKSDWATRLMTGKEALITSVMQGKGFMLPTGGGGVTTREQISVLVDYMLSTLEEGATSYTPVRQVAKGLALYSATCYSCHNTGINDTPRLGDKQAWRERVKKGVPTLAKSVLASHGSMITQSSSTATSAEAIEEMVHYMLSTLEP